MSQPQLLNRIFPNVATSDDASSHLKQIIVDHPYFGLAQFYNLKHANTEDLIDRKIAAKTGLFFTNNFYLRSQLDADVVIPVTPSLQEELVTNSLPVIVENGEEVPGEKEELLFEPLHASDYFASQGIKLSEDALGTDKLGKQLKSFTAWLKTMKKVHPDKLPIVNKTTETAVQTQAEQSNIEEEIVTEPMAEAYVLQNKQAKAIEIYNKLSLLNPAKSAYFAAKIDSLKN